MIRYPTMVDATLWKGVSVRVVQKGSERMKVFFGAMKVLNTEVIIFLTFSVHSSKIK